MATDLGIPGIADALEVGRGGHAVVYRAEQPTFGRTVAVKVLSVQLDERALQRFERECQTMGALSDHPGIVPIFDAGTTPDGRPFLLMPFLSGGSLQDAVDDSGPLGWQRATEAGVRLAGALAAAHAQGIVHRDIKPANVLRSRYGEVMLADFGIARVAGGPQTTEGVVTASVAHAAPEVLEGEEPSVASDVYALASTVHALAVGRAPFQTRDDLPLAALIHSIISRPPPAVDGAPPGFSALLAAGMAKEPADRPPDAMSFGRALQDLQRAEGLPVTAMITATDHAVPAAAMAAAAPTAAVAPVARPTAPPQPEPPAPESDPTALLPDHAGTAPPPWAVAPAPARRSHRGLVLTAGIATVVVVGAAVVFAVTRGSDPGPVTLSDGVQAFADAQGRALVSAGTLGPGLQEVALQSDEAHALTVDLAEGQPVRMRTQITAEDDDAVLALFDPAGNEVISNDDSGAGPLVHDALIDWVALVAGAHTLVAYEFSGLPVTYGVELQLPPVSALEASIDGSLGEYEVDVYEVLGPLSDVIVTVESDEASIVVSVLLPNGEVVSDDDSDGAAHVLFTADEDARYTVGVTSPDADAGTYRLTAEGL